MNKKVYCKNCKYFGSAMNIPTLTCLEVYKEKLTNEYTGEVKYKNKRALSPSELNSDGNCKYYQRKWWKFCIK